MAMLLLLFLGLPVSSASYRWLACDSLVKCCSHIIKLHTDRSIAAILARATITMQHMVCSIMAV